jgi:hypothetical protein
MAYKKALTRGQMPEGRELTLYEVRQKINALDQEIKELENRRSTLVLDRTQWKLSLAQRLRHATKV